MKKNNYTNVMNILQQFLDDYFKDRYAALLTGSYADGNFNTESDIDIYVFTNTRGYVFNETFIYKELKIQAIHFPLHKVSEILWYDTSFKKRNLFKCNF